ncbi:MAG TPA: DUF4331 domain-containing protein [Pseudomonadales bacterium]|nr:DUF4331 domain-containing protein [Pseudomonadales bacterium]
MNRFKMGALACALLAAQTSFASSHREAPNISKMPAVDSTDFYMFNSYEEGRGDYVTLIANYLPLQDAYGGPNYFALDQNALYEIHIDNDGDAKENLTFQFRFKNKLANNNQGIALNIGDKSIAVPLKNVGPIDQNDQSNLNFAEAYNITLVKGDRRKGLALPVINASNGSVEFTKPFDYVGNKTFADYAAYANSFIQPVNIPGCAQPGKVFVGQRKEGFAVNLGKVFDLVNLVPVEGDSAPGAGDGKGFPGGITQNPANNIIADKNVTSIALEIHKSCLVGKGNGVIGGWTSASMRQARLLNPRATFKKPDVNGGPWVQVSRLGMPLVNELVIGIKDKDTFSASQPKNDAQFLNYVTNPSLPALLNVLFRDAVNSTLGTNISNLAPSNLPRQDLVTAFLTGFPGVNQLAKVTPSEMLRLNTGIAPVAANVQSTFGVAGGDVAGFPNGRRPGDDTVDIALRVVMGALCEDLPLGTNHSPVNLMLCGNTAEASRAAAPVGSVPFTDGAPLSASDFDVHFPYLTTPVSGSN